MIRTLALLVATLAAVALAAPAPKHHHGSSGKGSGSGSKHSFKSSTRGHRGHRDPRTEMSRVYNKFNWSMSKFTWSITLPESGSTVNFDFPPTDETSQGYDSSDVSPYGSSDSSSDESSADSSYGSAEGSSNSSSDASPADAPEPTYITVSLSSDAFATASPGSQTTESYDAIAPSSEAVGASDIATLVTRTSTAASFTASITASSSATVNGSDGDSGEVSATPEENESEYLSPVSIGGQELNLNFDTGSADLWVFSTSLSSSQLGNHSAFDPSKSSTWKDYSEGSWEISYGDGSGASGTVGFDTVDVGGATATGQAVELATVISSAFVSDENNDGLLGLAFGKINTIQPTQQKTFFENIGENLDEQLFTADLDLDASGTYEFGKLDTSKYQGELHTTPIDNSNGFWQFASESYSINGEDVKNSNASPAIADTGTSLVMVDEEVAKAFYGQIEGSSMSSEAGGYVYPCDADVPSFGVEIGTGGFMAHINGSDIEYARISSNSCFGGIQGNGGQGLQIYGAVLLKQYFAVFNFGDLTFGLAQKN